MKRIALITGAAGSGIGARTAEALARRNYVVAATDIDEAGLRSTVDRLDGEGHRGIVYDVADKKAALRVFDEVERELGPVSVLVCSAGYIAPGSTGLEIEDEDWDRSFAVNVSGVFYALREYFRRRKAKPMQDGRIILISSISAHRGTPRADYAVSKGAVLTLVKSAAHQGAPLGITANGIAPGAIDTPLFRFFNDAERTAMVESMVPLGRIGKPEEIAAIISFLSSAEAGYITGVTIDVDGGICMR